MARASLLFSWHRQHCCLRICFDVAILIYVHRIGKTEQYYESLLSKLNGYGHCSIVTSIAFIIIWARLLVKPQYRLTAFYFRAAEHTSINRKAMQRPVNIFIELPKNSTTKAYIFRCSVHVLDLNFYCMLLTIWRNIGLYARRNGNRCHLSSPTVCLHIHHLILIHTHTHKI